MTKKKTIYELARELNIAPSTVSKALNNQKGVTAAKRKMIIDYANSVGYVATPAASMLKSKKSTSIGILYSEAAGIGFAHPFFSSVLESAKAFLEKRGYDIIFINSKSNDYHGYAQFCNLRNIAGIFAVTVSGNDPFLTGLSKTNEYNVVATDYYNDNIPTVVSDNKQGIRLLVDYYLKAGFKSVGIVTNLSDIPSRSFAERTDSYLILCKRNNIEIDNDNIISMKDYDYNKMLEVLKNHFKMHKPPEAIFAVTDMLATATISALKANGYEVPKDVSVIGFDDNEFAKYLSPSLSTIRQDTKGIGTTAAKTLLAQINGIEVEKDIRIPVSLILRESSKSI